MSDHHRPRNPAVIRVQGSKPIPPAASSPLPVARPRVAAPVQPAPRPTPQSFAAPNAIPLRTLEAQLQKVDAVTTTEIETGDDPEHADCKGMFVHRDADGDKFMWGPTPIRYEFHDVATVAEADHVMFLCPLCFAKNGGSKGTHSVMVTFAGRNVPDEAGCRNADGKPSRWTASGSTLDDLVLTPSILLDAKRPQDQGCHWHGFVGSSGVPAGHAR